MVNFYVLHNFRKASKQCMYHIITLEKQQKTSGKNPSITA
jgi:hypothetical protein